MLTTVLTGFFPRPADHRSEIMDIETLTREVPKLQHNF